LTNPCFAENAQHGSISTKISIDPYYHESIRIGLGKVDNYDYIGHFSEVVTDIYFDTTRLDLYKHNVVLRNRKNQAKNKCKWALKIKMPVNDSISHSNEITISDKMCTRNIADIMTNTPISIYLENNLNNHSLNFKKIYTDKITRYKTFFTHKNNVKQVLQVSYATVIVSNDNKQRTYYEIDISAPSLMENTPSIKTFTDIAHQFIQIHPTAFFQHAKSKYIQGIDLLKGKHAQ